MRFGRMNEVTQAMSIPLQVLILDDSRPDTELISRELERAGFAPDWRQAASKSEYLAALDTAFDIILADYTLPDFDALVALQYLKERRLKTPFIVVTGSLGDEAAAECQSTRHLLKSPDFTASSCMFVAICDRYFSVNTLVSFLICNDLVYCT
jgi:CheY-like chemotaxis protein